MPYFSIRLKRLNLVPYFSTPPVEKIDSHTFLFNPARFKRLIHPLKIVANK